MPVRHCFTGDFDAVADRERLIMFYDKTMLQAGVTA